MKELTDYGGEFLPDLKPEDFSHDALVDLVKIYSKLYTALDGFWYLAVRDKESNEVALECDILAWRKQSKYEMAKLAKRFNITGNDVIAFFKGFQLAPWYWTLQTRMEIESPAKGVLTVVRCPTLEALEKEGAGRESQICNTVEPVVLSDYATFFNPNIKVECRKIPPRPSRDGIACQWEFRLEPPPAS